MSNLPENVGVGRATLRVTIFRNLCHVRVKVCESHLEGSLLVLNTELLPMHAVAHILQAVPDGLDQLRVRSLKVLLCNRDVFILARSFRMFMAAFVMALALPIFVISVAIVPVSVIPAFSVPGMMFSRVAVISG